MWFTVIKLDNKINQTALIESIKRGKISKQKKWIKEKSLSNTNYNPEIPPMQAKSLQ